MKISGRLPDELTYRPECCGRGNVYLFVSYFDCIAVIHHLFPNVLHTKDSLSCIIFSKKRILCWESQNNLPLELTNTEMYSL